MVWMPAHTKTSAVGTALLSDGSTLSSDDRLGNMLADLMAKKGVEINRVPLMFKQKVELIDKVVDWACRRLASNTWHANNHQIVCEKNGKWEWHTKRDSTGVSKHHRPPKRKIEVVEPPSAQAAHNPHNPLDANVPAEMQAACPPQEPAVPIPPAGKRRKTAKRRVNRKAELAAQIARASVPST